MTLREEDLNILIIVVVTTLWIGCMVGVFMCGKMCVSPRVAESVASSIPDESIPEWATEYLPRKLRLTKEQERSLASILRKAHAGNRRLRSTHSDVRCTICLDSLTEDRSAQESLTSTPRTACSHHPPCDDSISLSSSFCGEDANPRHTENAPDFDDDSHDLPSSNWTSFPCGHSFHVLCFEVCV